MSRTWRQAVSTVMPPRQWPPHGPDPFRELKTQVPAKLALLTNCSKEHLRPVVWVTRGPAHSKRIAFVAHPRAYKCLGDVSVPRMVS